MQGNLDAQDPMIGLARELIAAAGAYNTQDSAENEARTHAAVDAVVQGAKVTSMAGALAAVAVIEHCGETFLDTDAEAAFKALAAWLRQQASTSAFEQERGILMRALKGERRGKAA